MTDIRFCKAEKNPRATDFPSRPLECSDVPWGAHVNTTGGGSQACWTNNGDYVDIQGFDIRAPGDAHARGGILYNGSYCRIIGNHVHDVPATDAGNQGGSGIVNANYTGAFIRERKV